MTSQQAPDSSIELQRRLAILEALNHPRRALAWDRFMVGLRILFKRNHPGALADAAMVWMESRRYEDALLYASACLDALRESSERYDTKIAAAWAADAVEVGLLAACRLHARARTPEDQQRLTEDATHWMRIMAASSPGTLAFLCDDPVLRDLRSHAEALLKITDWEAH